MKQLKTIYTLCSVILILVFYSCTKTDIYPGETWDTVKNPEKLGYSTEKLDKAKTFTDSLHTAAVVIVVDGRILMEWGEVDKKFMTHSSRPLSS